MALPRKEAQERKKATVVFTGDGGTSEGDFHEALNVAAVWDLPVLFVLKIMVMGSPPQTMNSLKVNPLRSEGRGTV